MKRAADRPGEKSASQIIDKRIEEFADWRGETLGRIRAPVHEAVPDVVEEWKWRGTPVWSHIGIIFTGETYKSVVKPRMRSGDRLEGHIKKLARSITCEP